MIEQYFEQVWFFPSDSMAYKYTINNEKVSATTTSVHVSLSLARVINVKFSLRPHQKHYITQYGELANSTSLVHVRFLKVGA